MTKTAADIMTASPRTIASSATVREAAKLMKDEDVGSLPVVQQDRLVGVVTDRDIAVRVVAEGRDATTPVAEVASNKPVTVEPSANLEQALELMAEHQVRRLPVVEGDRLVGVIAQADIARLGKDKRTGDLLEELSQP
ncbi:MAG: CBS domain-containing protein [Gaiellaceae bacterium]